MAKASLSLAEAQASVDAASGVDLKVFDQFEAEWVSGDFPGLVEAQLAAVASLHNPLVHQGAVAKGLADAQGPLRAQQTRSPDVERWLFIRA